MTERERDILTAIVASQRVRGHGPTLVELKAVTGYRSNRGIEESLRALERQGALLRMRSAFGRQKTWGLVPTPVGEALVGPYREERSVEYLDMGA